MFETAQALETVESSRLTDMIDMISTRLILDGAPTIDRTDFEQLAQAATQAERAELAKAAKGLGSYVAKSAGLSIPGLTRTLSSGLVELRRLLDDPTAMAAVSDAALSGTAELASAPFQSEADKINPLAADEDLIREFVTESREHLSTVERQMLLLEKDVASKEILNSIFRPFHTIKGLAGFLGFGPIEALTHEVETLLDLARTSQLKVSSTVVDMMLESTDALRHEVAGIELQLVGKMPPPSNIDEALLQRLRGIAGTTSTTQGNEAGSMKSDNSVLLVAQASMIDPSKVSRCDESSDSGSIRIEIAKLDQLMDMVSEMAIAQALVRYSPALASVNDLEFLSNIGHMTRITTDIQHITTRMRMVPIGIQFQKTARLVRDLSRKAGKQIILETSGEDTELDKSIAEELSDPLLHMVRNSIDHGIEPPAERIALGKDPTSRIRISAYHQSGQIVIEISDDGRGLNCAKILAKARATGLVTQNAQLTENEIFLLIFEAGFSTAEKITDISGRGVGMDVVLEHVQRLRGRIDIQSKAGQGTTFFLRLPLTLAIVEGQMVRCAGEEERDIQGNPYERNDRKKVKA